MSRVTVHWGDERPENLRDPDELELGPIPSELNTLRKFHEESDHGLYALEALAFCHEARLVPPQWCVDWLGQRIGKWFDMDDLGSPVSLEKVLGVANRPGRYGNLKDRLERQNERQSEAQDIFILNDICGISVEKAAEMVHKLRKGDSEEGPVGADWMAEYYLKIWCTEVGDDDRELLRRIYSDEQRLAEFRATFPDP